MDHTNARRLSDIADRAEILDCLNRYARGMDRHDRDLARSAYHDDAIDDHLGFSGPVDDFLDWAFTYQERGVRHQHYIGNHLAEIDGDSAHAETYFFFVASPPDDDAPLSIYGGRYIDRLERRDGRWSIVVRRLLVEWATSADSSLPVGDLGVGGHIARDRTDCSYQRPLEVDR